MNKPGPFVAAHWGAYRAEMKAGRAVALHPFEDDPDPSGIGAAMLETLDDPCRIDRPMVRRGYLDGDGGAARGRDSFVALDWDEALDMAAAELERVRREHGNQAIYAGSYGWASAGRFHHASSQLRRFMGLFGGYTYSRNTYSYAAGEVILPHVVGDMLLLLQEHGSWDAMAERRSLVVSFGGLSLRNAQINSGGVGRHSQRGDIRQAVAAGARIVNIGPQAMERGDAIASEWVKIRPNTDLALMLAVAHTLYTEGLHDAAFLESHCVGFERFKPYLTGESDGAPKDAAWAAAITGMPAAEIAALARRMAAGPTTVNVSWSLTRQENGEQNYWMAVVLAAMLGGIGRPGEGFTLGLAAVSAVGSRRSALPVAALPPVRNPVGAYIPVARIADMLLNPGGTFRYDGKTLTYPDIKLVYWVGGNPFHHHQDLNRLRRAWERIGTVVAHEPHWTPMARFADIVFPATLSAERDDLAGSPRDTYLFATRAVSPPFGEARNDHDIFAGLARRLSPADGGNTTLYDAFTEGRDQTEWIRHLYEETRLRLTALGVEAPEFEEFRERGFLETPPAREQALLAGFRADPARAPLSTPSGKIEIFSETISGFALDGLPGHPCWREPSEWLGSPRTREHPLHLISHQPERRLHSQLDQSSHSRAGKIQGRAECVLNPKDARRRGVADGDLITVFNARGACFAGARLSEDVMEGVAMMATGAWYDPDWTGGGEICKHGNPNVLTPDLPTSELGQGPAALTCLVEIARHEGDAPPVTAFDPPEIQRGER
ncbi:MAG: molybdopterin-dependent oxidoreductase [Paracoccaceae bacterium]